MVVNAGSSKVSGLEVSLALIVLLLEYLLIILLEPNTRSLNIFLKQEIESFYKVVIISIKFKERLMFVPWVSLSFLKRF